MTAFEALSGSLKLDYEFICHVPGIPFPRKLLFILKKYGTFLKDALLGLKDVNSVTVFGLTYNYNEIYGLASLQRVYCASHRLRGFLPEQPVIVDVGANIGQFTFFCRQYLHARRIISIEPAHTAFKLLVLNSGAPEDCLHFAVSKVKTDVLFYVAAESSQLSSYVADTSRSYRDRYRVPADTLDEIVSGLNLSSIDLLKIDTEGSEYDIITAADEVLDKSRLVMIEMSIFRESAGNLFQSGVLLEKKGFVISEFVPGPGIHPADVNAVFQKI